MNVYARFDEIPSMTFQNIEEQNVTDTRTDGQCENSIPTHNTQFAWV